MFFANLCEKLFCLEYITGQGELLFLTFFKAMFSGFKKNVHCLNTLYHLENKISVSHAIFSPSIIALVIVEILILRLVEGCIVLSYNHLAQCDYSRSAKF